MAHGRRQIPPAKPRLSAPNKPASSPAESGSRVRRVRCGKLADVVSLPPARVQIYCRQTRRGLNHLHRSGAPASNCASHIHRPTARSRSERPYLGICPVIDFKPVASSTADPPRFTGSSTTLGDRVAARVEHDGIGKGVRIAHWHRAPSGHVAGW